jgi:hypothetical protein
MKMTHSKTVNINTVNFWSYDLFDMLNEIREYLASNKNNKISSIIINQNIDYEAANCYEFGATIYYLQDDDE